jgi:riboflavin biosynthesis protein RibD
VSAEDDRRHMRHTLGLGARGLGNTWPNPAVGCVIVQDSRIVGRGWTQPGGRPHAEPMALAQAGAAARGATAYVTLEPCAHHGQTPPCAEALIAAGVARVVTALHDPDPRVAGQGHARLLGAGIAVTEGVEAEAARARAQQKAEAVRGAVVDQQDFVRNRVFGAHTVDPSHQFGKGFVFVVKRNHQGQIKLHPQGQRGAYFS